MDSAPLTVGTAGEFNLVARLRAICAATTSPDTIIGIGDDTAVLRLDDREVLLATCDIQIEGTHFRFDTISPYQLGRRAIAVNLSDIAAMGGHPTHAFVSLALPSDFPVADFDALFEGMRDMMAAHGASIDGGNLAASGDHLMIDVFLLGRAEKSALRTRAGAHPGDGIYITGSVGASSAGLAVLTKYGSAHPALFRDLVRAHLEPEPRVAAGIALAQSGAVTAMIDISDGLAADLGHVCNSSNAGAEIEYDLIPHRPEIDTVARELNREPAGYVLYGGEDYELLFTVSPEREADIAGLSATIGLPMTRIGRITGERGRISVLEKNGSAKPLTGTGWDHFRKTDNRM